MKSFKQHDRSNVTFKFIFTGLTALSLLFVICAVFSIWYFIRKRREEKQRRSQHIEDTFSERLASRSVAGKSQIDVGFTSQQNLNEGNEDEEPRAPFSRFLRLWKDLRNSKRKPANDEPRKDVVFTIPTQDVFPKTHTRQQTYHPDVLTQTDGIDSHKCEVHRVTYDVTENYSNHNLHHLEEEQLDTKCENETYQVEDTNEILPDKSGSTQAQQRIVGKQTDTPGRKISDEKYIQGKEDGKSFSKESDVDSGCGSSCHEIYRAIEPPVTHAQLNVSSLVCHAQTTEKDRFWGNVHECKEHESSRTKVVQKSKKEPEYNHPNEQWSEFQKSQCAIDSFEELIKLAKDGMSTLARKRVDTGGKRNTISECFRATTSVDNLSRTHDTSTNTGATLQKKDEGLDTKTESQSSLNARKVDSGIKCSSSTSSCLNDSDNAGETKTLHHNNTQKQSETSIGITLHSASTEIHTEKSMEKALNYTGNHSGIAVNAVSHRTDDNQPDTSISSTTVVEIPTITLESELGVAEDLSEKTIETNQEAFCTKEDSFHHETQQVNQRAQGKLHEETNTSSNNSDTTFSIPNHQRVRIQESLLNNGQVIVEKSARPKSMVLPTSENSRDVDKSIYGLKVTSLETLNLPSHGQAPAAHSGGRIRSFSATIRRKLSFRDERSNTEEMDMDGQNEPRNKKLKGFRSFRMNRKKKTKGMKSEESSQSTGNLFDSGKYVSTIDKIFHENTGSAVFSDVPFTIPEISE